MPTWKQAEPREFVIRDVDTGEILGTQSARGWWQALSLWQAQYPEHATRHLDAEEPAAVAVSA